MFEKYKVDGRVETKKPTIGKDTVFLTEQRSCAAHKEYACGRCRARDEPTFNFKWKKAYLSPKKRRESFRSPTPKRDEKRELKYEPYAGSKYY